MRFGKKRTQLFGVRGLPLVIKACHKEPQELHLTVQVGWLIRFRALLHFRSWGRAAGIRAPDLSSGTLYDSTAPGFLF